MTVKTETSKAALFKKMEKALRLMGSTHTLEDVVDALKKGEMQLFHNDRAVVITEIAVSPRRKFANVFMSAGELDGVIALKGQLVKWAKDNGIEFARAAVRPGYEKYLKDAGWKTKMVLMDFDLKGN
jgi:glycerol-3-phosphate responsive antiterminator